MSTPDRHPDEVAFLAAIAARPDDALPRLVFADFLEENDQFEVDPYYNRLKVTYCPGGFLKRVKKRRS